MYHRLTLVGLLAFVASASCASGAPPATLQSATLAATFDPTFPRVIQYTWKKDGSTFEGQAMPVASVLVNDRATSCEVTFTPTGADGADYQLTFPSEAIKATLHVTVGAEAVELKLTSVQETGGQRLHTLTFPNDALLTIHASQPNAALATTLAYVTNNDAKGVYREQVGPLSARQAGDDTANYFFASAGNLAAGVADNGIVDGQRIAYRIGGAGGESVCSVWMPTFQYREIDTETLDAPYVNVIVTGDRNGDGRADWQDAAIAYRDVMPHPLGSDGISQIVADQIAMEYASGAQQPFLRILDEMKKVYLATDGLGQEVQVKGFTAEGHDQSNTDMYGHVNMRAGGQDELNYLIDKAHTINGHVGVHVNVSEVYPEARRYDPKILRRNANGGTIQGWNWLDVSELIDKRKDVLSGGLYAELDGLHKAMPDLDYLYVDTYWDNGWVAYKLATKVNSLGLPLYTEGPTALDAWTAWAHIDTLDSQVMRFLWYGRRDLFGDDPILRATKRVGFMGYDGAGDFNLFIDNVFSRNLIARYLQSFALLAWQPGMSASFDGGVKVAKAGDTTTVTRDGRLVATWTGAGTGNRLFVPWDPRSEKKVYVWDEVGGPQTWKVPTSWPQSGTAYLYALDDTGRTGETKVPVANGQVTLTVEKSKPYVLYPAPAPAEPVMAWGDGSPVKDPGFDSHSLTFWKPNGDASAIQVANDAHGNTRLVIGPAGGEVSQDLAGLTAGKTYAASVWIDPHGTRTGTIEVKPDAAGAAAVSNFVNDHIRHAFPLDPRSGSSYQRVKVLFDVPVGCTSATLTLRADKGGAGSSVEFDDVRVVESGRSPEASKHWFWEDFEHVDQGYGPFSECPVENTHLSEAHPPYTTDVISGKYSLKTRNNGRVLRTTPSALRFKPHEHYHLEMDTLTDPGVTARASVETYGQVLFQAPFPDGRGHISGDFSTGGDSDTFIAIYKETHTPGDMAVMDNIAIDDLGAAAAPSGTPTPDKDAIAGTKAVIDEGFNAPLPADWTTTVSPQPGTVFAVADGALRLTAHANTSSFVEHKLPTGVTAVEARIQAYGDEGLSWGPGVALLWPDGAAVKVSLRNTEFDFGVDSTVQPQVRAGFADADQYVVLRLRIDAENIIAEARTDWGDWQQLATIPKAKYPGLPDRVRVGKMAGAGGPGDYSDPGPLGDTAILRLRVLTPG